MAAQIVNDVEAFGVSIEPANVGLGETYWRVVRIHDATPQASREGQHIYVDALDERGENVTGTAIQVSSGAGTEEAIVEDRGLGQPGASFLIRKDLVYSLQILGFPSDVVRDLNASPVPTAQSQAPVSRSYHIVFQRSLKKVFTHYVLFGPPTDSQTQANLLIALGYILRFKPAFGFKVEEAELAERVTIIGGPDVISLDAQDRLEEAGCWVHRIEGDSRAVDRVLTELQRLGVPFPQ